MIRRRFAWAVGVLQHRCSSGLCSCCVPVSLLVDHHDRPAGDGELYRPWTRDNYICRFWTNKSDVEATSSYLFEETTFASWCLKHDVHPRSSDGDLLVLRAVWRGLRTGRLNFPWDGSLGPDDLHHLHWCRRHLRFIEMAQIIRNFQLGDTPLRR